MSHNRINVGIVGGTGYTGIELLRLLALHPFVRLSVITSRAEAGRPVSNLFPSLRGHLDLVFTAPNDDLLHQCDLVFFATPNGVAMQSVVSLLENNVRVIDLAADFRLKDQMIWEQWYQQAHVCPDVLDRAVYGLPEVNRVLIKNAQLVANPGCYPTAVQLGLLPLMEKGLIHDEIIADCKSGVSGAGRKASIGTALSEVSESITAYCVDGHRHLPEIKQGLAAMTGAEVGLTFVPHLMPMIRGIHATMYVKTSAPAAIGVDFQALYDNRYKDEPFVDVLPKGSHPDTRNVKGSNECRIAIHQPQQGNTLVILAVIDNLVKGAAGQAVQNLNIMFGFDETTGLNHIALVP
ncbi:MAG: N-acetyl-gamma-glutamyl-phosphate reductase [Gammaproteobacteria bacterium]|nr:N-acetyl-gamma-glutamyl-phosphate reductase [Gammaproteobacteria bacterium]